MPPRSRNPLAERFEKSNGILKPRLIWRGLGEFGTGKTHFALTAPGPIVFQSFDKGLEGVALEEYGKKDIYPIEYEWSPAIDDDNDDSGALQEMAREIRNKFIEDFVYACKHARTVVWDKEDDVWEVFRYAEFGKPSDQPNNFAPLNNRYRKYVNMPKSYDINFGCIQGLKNEWVTIRKKKPSGETVEKGAPSGNRVPKGFIELEGLVHVNITHRREGGNFLIDVGKARGPAARDIQDQTFENLSFAEFAQLVFPETSEEDWL